MTRRRNDIWRAKTRKRARHPMTPFLYLERIMRDRCIKSRVASRWHSRGACIHAHCRYKYLQTATRTRDTLNMRGALNVPTRSQPCVRLTSPCVRACVHTRAYASLMTSSPLAQSFIWTGSSREHAPQEHAIPELRCREVFPRPAANSRRFLTLQQLLSISQATSNPV